MLRSNNALERSVNSLAGARRGRGNNCRARGAWQGPRAARSTRTLYGMKANQLNRGSRRRLMCVENKSGDIDGVAARIGWVSFSNSGKSVLYRNRELCRIKGGGIRGNYVDAATGDEYWVSGVKTRGSNTHWAESTQFQVDDDAADEYRRLKDSHAV